MTERFNDRLWKQSYHGKWAGQTMIYKDVTGSTNEDAARMAEELPHGAVIVADAQTAGRGRRGRSWVSAPGENLYFSLLLKPDFAPEQASMLTLVMALAVAQGIEAVYVGTRQTKATHADELQSELQQVQIKWPNDIVIGGKKVCGILTEMQAVPGSIRHVVIGVGININQAVFEEEGLMHASSLYLATGRQIDRQGLLAEVLCRFETLYAAFCQAASLKPILKAYQDRLVNQGKEVRVLEPQGAYEGIALGVDEQGQLLVQRADGSVEAVYAGEVSVRGIYGYV